MRRSNRPALAAVLLGLHTATTSAQCPTPTQLLTPTRSAAGQNFGFTLDAEPSRLVVGARFDDTLAADAGSALVYDLIDGRWVLTAQLFATDADAGDAFGMSVSIDGNRIAVGALSDDEIRPDAGAAYVFDRVGGQWIQTAKVTSPGLKSGSLFGVSIDLQGETRVVGAREQPAQQVAAGAVYVYEHADSGWSQVNKLVSPDASANARFGHSVAIAGDTMLVGSHRQSHSGLNEPGAAYVFARSESRWSHQQTLTHPAPQAGAMFGVAVDLEDGLAVISSRRAETPGHGTGYASVYRRPLGEWAWTEDLRSPAAQGGEEFGSKVSLHNGKLLIGAWLERSGASPTSGAAYLFEHAQDAFLPRSRLTGTEPTSDIDAFGHDVVLAGNRPVVAAFGQSVTGAGSGAVYSFEIGPCLDCPADLNADGVADTGDIQQMVDLFLDRSPKADTNADGVIDHGDLAIFVQRFLSPC